MVVVRGGSQSVEFFLSFVYICIAVGDPDIKGEGWVLINQFNPAILCACPKPGHGFQTSYGVVFFVLSVSRREVIVRFGDIGGIVDHRCLIFFS